MAIAPGAVTAPAVSAAAALTGTYGRVIALCDALDARTAPPGPASGGRITGADLAQSEEALDAFIDAEAVRIRERHGHTARRDVVASRALHHYLWSISLLMSGPWHLDRRVPRIHPDEVRLDLATGAFEIASGSGFACLPDDPAAGLPGARVTGHEEALRAELRAAVVDHARPLLAAIRPQLRRGPRTLWGMVTDDLISGIWYLGRILDQEEQAVRAATELLPHSITPFPGGADFRHLAGRDGRGYSTRTRLGCCLYYKLDQAQACLTCPRTCDAERIRRLEGED